MARKLDCFSPLLGITAIKDIHSTYCNVSSKLSQLLGWSSAEEAVGKTDYDIPCDVCQFAAEFQKTDKKVIETNSIILTLDFQNYCTGWELLLVEKNVLKNKQGEIEGLYLQGVDLSSTNLYQGYLLLYNLDAHIIGRCPKAVSYVLNLPHSYFSLTQKQEACLFFLIRGKSVKEIAKILKLSPRTVESHLQAIKNKMNCNCKTQVIEKAIDSGFLYHIPKDLLEIIFNKG